MDLARRISNLSPKQRELLESKLKERNIDVSQISQISRVKKYLKQQEKAGYPALKPVEKKEYCPLSSVQRRLYFLWQFDDKKIAYNISCRLEIENSIDKVRLEDAFRRLIKRHETLRMSVEVVAGELVQRIHEQVEFAIEYWEQNVNGQWSSVNSTYPAHSPGSIIKGFIRPFDLSGVPLLRSGLIKLAEEKYILMVDMHHIITDGTSLNLFIKEWSALYAGKQLTPLKLQYKDYSEWQTSEEQKVTMKRQGKYWIKQLEGEIPRLELPYDYPRPELQDFEGDTVAVDLASKDTRGLSELAIGERATFFMVLLAVVTVWLSKLSNQEEILIGTPIAARRCVDLENIIGMFVNTLVIRNSPEGTKTFREFLKEVKKTNLQALENQEYPFEELVEKLVANREPGRNPLFDVMFTLQNMKTQEIDIPGMKITLHNEQQNTAKFDMVILCFEIDGTLRCIFEYSTKLYKRATIERFVNYFKKLIAIAIENPGIKIADIKIITDKEKKQVLFDFNDTRAAYPGKMTIHEWFAAQVVKTPDHIASLFAGQQLSYRALDARANQLARLLKEKGVKPDTIVGIMVKRSLEILIGIIGIWKAGGAYLPIDTQYPLERKKYMLMNSSVRLVLINYAGESPDCISPEIEVLDLRDKYIYQGETSDLNRISKCINLVYVIYTSGSTGNPKGVLLEHRNLVNLLDFQFRCTNIDCSKILQFATLCFDISFQEIFSALLSGGTIFLVSENTRTDIPKLFKMIEKNRLRTLFLPISFLKIIFSEENYITLIPGCITHIQTAGEQVVISNNFRKYLRDTNVYLHNHYGPSETHVVTTLTIDPRGNIPGLPSIGKPVANTRIYIMDKYAHLLPVGIPGELYIVGIQVGRGYLNRPELTSEKFINYKLQNTNYNVQNYKTSGIHAIMQSCNHASMPSPHYPIYITGDLARWLNDGNIEFLGRIDHQVKIRGFRIEVGEIEKQLLNHHQVKEAVVEVKTDENIDKYLCAYVVPNREQGPGNREYELRKDGSNVLPDLRDYLSGKLPDYMIPARFMLLENIPLTPNGKINRKALPEPGIELRRTYMAPGNKLEEKLVEIWSHVLGIEKSKISIYENFFALGGHSLKAAVMTAKIHKELNVELPLVEVFKHSTISKLSRYLKREGLAKDKYQSIESIEKKEYYTLSSVQKRLYILQQVDPQSTAYNIPYFLSLLGEIHIGKLDNIFKKLIQRHEALRTSFEMIEGEPVQKIHIYDDLEFAIENDRSLVNGHWSLVNYQDRVEVSSPIKVDDYEGTRGLAPLSIEPGASNRQPEMSYIKNFICPFDLYKAPLLRVGLINLSQTSPFHRSSPAAPAADKRESPGSRYLLMLDMHHIIADGVSEGLLIEDLVYLYGEKELPPLYIQYKDFSQWQHSTGVVETIKNQEIYWLKEFEGEIPVLSLPTDFSRPVIQEFVGSVLHFEIGKEDTAALRAYALEVGATLFIVLLAIYYLFLFKISSQEDIVVGTPIAGRRHSDLEDIVGMFVNTLVILNFPSGEKDFTQFLGETQRQTLKAFENQDYPYEELVEKVFVGRDPGRNPLFDVMFVLQNFEIPTIDIPGLKISPCKYQPGISKFDLTLQCIEIDETLQCSFEYSTKLFKEVTIQRFINSFKKILSIVIENPAIKISDIEIITAGEKRQVLYEFNDTRTCYPKGNTIQQLFAEQAANAPDHTAVTAQMENSNLQLTYNRLDQSASQLADLLETKGVQVDAPVGIMVERSMDMMVGLLGILKAGGAYLPIDPGYPQERIDLMLNDSQTQVLLVGDSSWASRLSSVPKALLNLSAGHHPGLPASHLPSSRHPSSSNLAYIIYTSGSSGQPKGVMVEHFNVIRLVKNNNYIDFREDDRILQTGSLAFDASTFEIWGSLLNGLGLYLVSNKVILTPGSLKQTLHKNAITTMWLTSSLFNRLLDADIEIFKELKNLLVGGDLLSPLHINRLRSRYPGLNIINGYGPTENTTFSTTYLVDKEYKRNIPIGRPIANSHVFIMDKYKHLLPIGIPGELIVGGDGTARGYLNQPGLTAQKFILAHGSWHIAGRKALKGTVNSPTIYELSASSYIYKTGDLARWLADGNIEFLGRMDHQVKIRGFRIELGEIEVQLLKYPGIKETVVLAREDEAGDKYLCVYFVPEIGLSITIGEIRQYLLAQLPGYMLPAYFKPIEKIPLTSNGKVDRKALPDPEVPVGKGYIAPRNNLEEKLVEIWSEVLNLEKEKISIDGNFFEIGGHSLKATMMIAKISKTINVKLPLAEVFKTPNIEGLSGYINTREKREYQSVKPVEKKDYYALSSAQKRLYILQQMDLKSTAYNIPNFFHLSGQLDRMQLENTFKKMIHRHESLRTSFTLIEEEPVQQVHDQVEFEIEYKEVEVEVKVKVEEEKERSSLLEGTRGLAPLWIPGDGGSHPAAGGWQPAASTIKNFIRPFDFSQAPLLRVGLIKLLHTPAALRGHPSQEGIEGEYLLLVDIHHIISDGVSIGILINNLAAFYTEKELTGPRIQYKDFVRWQCSQEVQDSIKQQKAYWLKEFIGEIPELDLPMDFTRPLIQDFSGNVLYFEIGKNETTTLKACALERGTTLFTILLTIYNLFLFKISSQEDIVVGTPIAGRVHTDLEDIVGMFVNTLALRNFSSEEKDFNQFLGETQQQTLQAFEHQDYPYEELVEKVVVSREPGRNPLFDVMFVLQNVEIPTIDIPGLKLRLDNYQSSISKFDLTLQCIEIDESLRCSFEYSTKLFKTATIQRFIKYFKKITSVVIKNPRIKIADIEIITKEEKEKILYDFNYTGVTYPEYKTLHQLLQEQVERTPNNTALVDGNPKLQIPNSKHWAPFEQINAFAGRHLSYRELNENANQLAYLLIEKGIRPDNIVGIMIERSVEMIIGILGILKSDGSYLPIDPNFPRERISYMLADSSAKILVTMQDLSKEIDFKTEVIYLSDALNRVPTTHLPPLPPSLLPSSSPRLSPAASLAYIIYTSGSTGNPKGVLITHQNVCPLMHWGYHHLKLSPADHTFQNLSYFFDWSVWEIFITLTSGAVLYMADDETKLNPPACVDFMEKHHITVLHITPTQFQYFINIKKKLETLRGLFIGAEKLNYDLVQRSYRLITGNCRIFNMYGPTEAAIISTAFEIHRSNDEQDRYNRFSGVPLGKPVSNTKILVLDKYRKICVTNVPGELYLAGDGLAPGYLNNPGLTAEKFVRAVNSHLSSVISSSLKTGDRFSKGTNDQCPMINDRLYRTGDRVRHLSNGDIEFLGRIDHQVKIRGFRVELGEIENQLLKYQNVRDAVVLVNEDATGEKYICAYLVPGETLSIVELKQQLAQQLPDYMIPSYFLQIEKIPLNPNGKLDRQALPVPDLKAGGKYKAPRNDVETKLVEIWAEVLGINMDIIGIDENFFLLGGHSLRATTLIAKINKELNVILPLAEIFRTPTIRGLSDYIKDTSEDRYVSIQPAEKKEYYSLSSMQSRLYILQQHVENTVYNIPQIVEFEETIEKEKLEEITGKLIRRHESLRTSFEMVNDKPVQRIHRGVKFEIEYYDMKEVEVEVEGERSSLLVGTRGLAPLPTGPATRNSLPTADLLISSFIRPFDLSRVPLFRVGLIKSPGKKYILMVDMHHIISDGVSNTILIQDFNSLFAGEELPWLKLQYKDYSEWLNSPGQIEGAKKQEDFWAMEFEGEIPALNLPIDYPRPAVQTFQGNSLYFDFGIEETRGLNNLARSGDATLFMILFALFNVLLSKISNQEDIIIGSPIAGRRHSDLEQIIGFFVNTLALRNFPGGEKTFMEFLGEVKKRTLNAFENQEYQFEDLVEKIFINRDPARNPLFDVMFALQNVTSLTDTTATRIEAGEERSHQNIGYENRASRFDMTWNCNERGNHLFLSIEYCTKLFREETIWRFIDYLKKIVSSILSNPSQKISNIEMISEEEKQQLLYDFNDTGAIFPENKALHELFEDQIEALPDSSAIIFENSILSYRELNAIANHLARQLKIKNVRADSIVAIMMERSVEMIIGILGILKSGCAYLPIEPDYPAERINYMLSDSSARVLVTKSFLVGKGKKLIGWENEKIFLENLTVSSAAPVTKPSPSLLDQSPTHVTSLAYIIYTSGSTGRPKGTIVEHHSIINLICNQRMRFRIDDKDRILQFSPICFDASVEQIFIALSSGAALVLIRKEDILDQEKFEKYISTQSITHIHAVPSFLNNMKIKPPCSLKRIISGGDICSAALAKKWSQLCDFFNKYGPTETTVTSIEMQIKQVDETLSVLPIGKPISNTIVYLLNKWMQPVPINSAGELIIGGAGVARGYLNNPELTAEKFVMPVINHSSFKSVNFLKTHDRLYHTGDLAKWLPDGNIEFLGRIDHQVKIRGFRIELGEIESQLLDYEGIKESVVVPGADENKDDYLCAYIISGIEIIEEELRVFLSGRLPDYMIPSFFIQMEKIPLTPNGKIERKALPLPEANIKGKYTAPGNEIQWKLVNIWSEVLGLESLKIGIDNNFFQFGGHSLKATIMISKIQQIFQVGVPLTEVFINPTIRGLAQYMEKMEPEIFTVKDPNLVLLKKTAANANNLFLVHDGSGEVEGYVRFCQHLHSQSDFNCWGLRADIMGNNHYGPREITIQELAKHYIEKIKKVQSQGPYYIAGWSLGGTIAFEMALQLEERGEKISLLGLLDSPGPWENEKEEDSPFTLESEIDWVWKYLRDEEIKEKVRKAVEINEIWVIILNHLEENHIRIETIKQLIPHHLAQVIPNYEQLGIKELIYYLNINRTLARARAVYLPSKQINALLHYFRASQSPRKFKDTWNDYCMKPIKSYEIPGNHYSIFKEPDVIRTAAIIEKVAADSECGYTLFQNHLPI